MVSRTVSFCCLRLTKRFEPFIVPYIYTTMVCILKSCAVGSGTLNTGEIEKLVFENAILYF